MSDSTQGPRSGRRDFLKTGGATTAALLASPALASTPRDMPGLPSNPRTPAAMPTRNLGKTGYKVGIFSLGGQAALERADNFDAAVPLIERALDLGVNYIDTSVDLRRPRALERAVRRAGDGSVAATRRSWRRKTKERTRDGSLRMIEKSLELLKTDHLDLWQLHDIGTMADVDEVFAKGGAMEALLEMKEQKVVRYLGVTGHYRPEPLIECIRRYPFDAILMAVNAADRHHYSFNEALLPLAVETADGHHRHEDSGPQPPALELDAAARSRQQKRSWEGMAIQTTSPGTLTMREAMHYALSLPVSTVIVGCDTIAQLEENVQLAREFTPLSERADGGARDEGRSLLEACALLPVLRAHLARPASARPGRDKTSPRASAPIACRVETGAAG